MINTSCLKPCLLLALLLLAACASRTPAPVTPESTPDPSTTVDHSERYTIDQDRAPTMPLDPDAIREVIPVPETRTIAGNFSPYTVNGRTYEVMASELGYEDTGVASWYGEKFHGHHTSNGEIFDMYQISAAHRYLPIPSYLRVTNLENQRSILVRVNDRGPFHSERIVDLSYAAAWKLGFSDQGTARVHLEAIVPGPEDQEIPQARQQMAAGGGGEYLQVGAFGSRQAAERQVQRVQDMTTRPVFIRSVETDNAGQNFYRVRVGPISDSAELDRITEAMLDADLGRPLVVTE